MGKHRLSFAVTVLCCQVGLPSSASAQRIGRDEHTALDRYVAVADDSYEWKLVQTTQDKDMITFVVDLTSQSWLTPGDVDRALWKHWLVIAKPMTIESNTALLYIDGGSNEGTQPRSMSEHLRKVAQSTDTVVAQLGMIPNQPLVFHADGKPRFEDDLVAYTWDRYLETGDERWPARLPMVKATVRAMDTIQDLLASLEGGHRSITKFVIAGASKRGWTTWMTAAVDQRVTAIVPMVIDVLNVNESMNHHYAAYGFWAPAINDYVQHKITDRRGTQRFAELLQLVDPHSYRERFTMPKCLINATGDEFFLPDSSRFYFDDLPDEKHLCYVPNASHSLKETNAIDTLSAFHYHIARGKDRPKYVWEFPDEKSIKVEPKSKIKPKHVFLWQATNPDARDFRMESIGKAYASTELKANEDGTYLAEVQTPGKGWTAFFVQMEFDTDAPTRLRLSTPVRIVPDTLPFADKEPATTEP